MSLIIKVKKNYDIGEILGKIRNSKDNKILIQASSESELLHNKENINILKNYGEKVNKEIQVQDGARFDKVGFVTGEDISSLDEKEIETSNRIKKSKISKFSIPNPFKKMNFKFNKVALSISAVILVLALAGSALAFTLYYAPKASVHLQIGSQVFTGTKEVIASTEIEQANENESTIPAVHITATESAELTEIPTGEKETGEKATGSITIFNKTNEDISIEENTNITIKIENENEEEVELSYVITESIDIPKKEEKEVTTEEGDESKAEVFGKEDVNITAANFGEEYNLEDIEYELVEISISELEEDEVDVEINEDPEGGSTEKVTVVTEKDREALQDKLEERLKKELQESLKNKTIQSQEVLDGAITYAIASAAFDKEIDEEADKFTLTMTMNADALVYSTEDLREVLSALIKDLIPNNYSVTENKEQYNIVTTVKSKESGEDGSLTRLALTNKVQSYVVPEINEEEISENLSGLSLEEAEEYLSNVSNISKAEINLTPANLPDQFKKIPRRVENINIEIATEERN